MTLTATALAAYALATRRPAAEVEAELRDLVERAHLVRTASGDRPALYRIRDPDLRIDLSFRVAEDGGIVALSARPWDPRRRAAKRRARGEG